MNVLIVSNEKAVSTQLRHGLIASGIDSSVAHVISRDGVLNAIGGSTDHCLVFLEIEHLNHDDLALLRQMRELPNAKAIVVGKQISASTILQAVRNGAVDGIGLDEHFDRELNHLLQRLKTSVGGEARVGQFISVLAPHGGAGATVIATNLAAALAGQQKQCCLLDLHWRGGDIALCLNSNPRHTLHSLSAKADQVDRTMFEQSLTRHACGVHFLASSEPHSNYRQISTEMIFRVVQLARGSYGTVVADMEDCDHDDQIRTLALSNQIVIPFRLDFIALVRLRKMLAHLTPANIGRAQLVLVANRTGQAKELTVHQAEDALGVQVHFQIPEDTAVMNEAINLGTPAAIGQPKSKSGQRLHQLALHLLNNEQNMQKCPAPGSDFAPASLMKQFRSWTGMLSMASA